MDETSGKTLWETSYAAPFRNAGGPEIAAGPYAMPQVVGDRIVMASGTGLILSLDKRTGRIVWTHDLYTEYCGTRLVFGYSCHALPYKDTLIVLAGGRPACCHASPAGPAPRRSPSSRPTAPSPGRTSRSTTRTRHRS